MAPDSGRGRPRRSVGHGVTALWFGACCGPAMACGLRARDAAVTPRGLRGRVEVGGVGRIAQP
jgi:hypothetical protein